MEQENRNKKNMDWRLQGQEKYLKNARLNWQSYKPYRKGWDHDHCEFCGAKFSNKDHCDLQIGYTTTDNYHWICENCFNDFKVQFCWKVDQFIKK